MEYERQCIVGEILCVCEMKLLEVFVKDFDNIVGEKFYGIYVFEFFNNI